MSRCKDFLIPQEYTVTKSLKTADRINNLARFNISEQLND